MCGGKRGTAAGALALTINAPAGHPSAANPGRSAVSTFCGGERKSFHFLREIHPSGNTAQTPLNKSKPRSGEGGILQEGRTIAAAWSPPRSQSTDRKAGPQPAGIGLPKGARGAEAAPNQTKERPGRADPIRSGRRPPSPPITDRTIMKEYLETRKVFPRTTPKGSHTAEHSVQRAGIPSIYKSTLPQ